MPSIATHDLGGQGRDLLLVHATGLHGHVWEPVARRLAGQFHCVALDVRGHGRSGPADDENMSWPRLAGDILSASAALGLRRPLGVGHSMGASLLLLAEQAAPGTFAGLYCIEPIGVAAEEPPAPDPDHPLVHQARRRRAVFESREAALAAYAARLPFSTVAPEALAAYVEHGFDETPDGTVRLLCEPETEAAAFTHGLAHPAYRDLAKVRCPVTLAVGRRSDAMTPARLDRWAARLTDARVEVLEAVGHFAPLEDPEAVAESVAAAFARIAHEMPGGP